MQSLCVSIFAGYGVGLARMSIAALSRVWMASCAGVCRHVRQAVRHRQKLPEFWGLDGVTGGCRSCGMHMR